MKSIVILITSIISGALALPSISQSADNIQIQPEPVKLNNTSATTWSPELHSKWFAEYERQLTQSAPTEEEAQWLYATYPTSPRPFLASADELYLRYAIKLATGASCTFTNVAGKVVVSNCGSCPAEVMQAKTTEVVEILYDQATSTDGFIAVDHSQSTIAVVFRGSKDLKNWLGNLQMTLRSGAPFTPKAVQVHSGFYNGYETVAAKVLATLTPLMVQYGKYQVLFTGHSLGGALSSLAASHFLLSRPTLAKRINLVTFGQPRTGDKSYTTYMDDSYFSSIHHLFRVVQNFDIVGTVPPIMFGYQHHANEIWYLGGRFYQCHDGKGTQDTACLYAVPAFELNTKDHSNYLGCS